MADEKTVQQKGENKSFWQKLGNFFKNLPANIAKPFKNMWHELRKVTWPTRKEVVTTTIMVFIMAALAAAFFAIVDLLIQWGVGAIIGA